MNEYDWLAERFESERPRLRAVAYQLLGSPSEADDAVQETWIRLSRSDTSVVENMSGWLTTIVARVALNMLSSRNSRRENLGDAQDDGAPRGAQQPVDPEQEAVLADSIGLALMVVLDTLTPAERLAFVLHDMFAVPFEEIAVVVDRSPAAARQLASRARRRVQRSGPHSAAADAVDAGVGAAGSAGDRSADGSSRAAGPATVRAGAVGTGGRGVDADGSGRAVNGRTGSGGSGRPGAGAGVNGTLRTGRSGTTRVVRPRDEAGAADLAGKAGLVRAFLAASREGQFEDLLAMLDPDIVLRADQVAVRLGADAEICGADAVTRAFVGRVWGPLPALIEGAPGLAWVQDGTPQVAFRFTIDAGRITAIDIQGDVAPLAITIL